MLWVARRPEPAGGSFPMKSLFFRLAPLFAAALLPLGALGQEAKGGPDPERPSTMSAQPSSPQESRPTPPPPPGESRFDWMLFPGMILLYFALQLWILPKMGVPT